MSDTVTIPTRVLTLAEWDALGDGDDVRNLEIVEGMLFVAPSPTFDHQRAAARLAILLERQLPADLSAAPDVDVVLVPDPPTVRDPDIVVAATARRRGRRLTAAEAVVVVELVSPGSRRTDRITKRSEYEDAAIPHYWVIDLDGTGEGPFVAYELVDGRYVEALRSADDVRLDRPHPIAFTLTELVAR